MGCTESKKKEAKGEADGAEAAAAAGVEVIVGENGETAKNDKPVPPPKKGKSAKAKDKKEKKGKEKKDSGDSTGAEGQVKNGKTGANSAKVRPLTPTPPVANQNVPKPVAFDVHLDGQAEEGGDNSDDASVPEASTVTASETGSGSGYRLRLPRKLPKLSSLTNRKDSVGGDGSATAAVTITNEDIQEKQRKAEEKRQEILEEKKQKARKFVEKFGNNSKNGSVVGSEGEEDEDGEEPPLNGMKGLDSGLGLDGYGLEGEVKIDDNGMTVTADGEDLANRIDRAVSATVVQADAN